MAEGRGRGRTRPRWKWRGVMGTAWHRRGDEAVTGAEVVVGFEGGHQRHRRQLELFEAPTHAGRVLGMTGLDEVAHGLGTGGRVWRFSVEVEKKGENTEQQLLAGQQREGCTQARPLSTFHHTWMTIG